MWISSFWGFPDSCVGKESACSAGDPRSIPGSGRSAGEGIDYPPQYSWASLVAQLVKNPPAMWETCVRSLGLGRFLGEGKGYPLQYSGLENSMDCIVPWGCKFFIQFLRLYSFKKKQLSFSPSNGLISTLSKIIWLYLWELISEFSIMFHWSICLSLCQCHAVFD